MMEPWQFPGGDSYVLPDRIEEAWNLTHAGDTQLHFDMPSGRTRIVRPGEWVLVSRNGSLRVVRSPSAIEQRGE